MIIKHSTLLFLFVAVSSVSAADSTENDTRRFNFGARADFIPLRMFNVSTTTASSTKPVADYNYRGTTSSPKFAGGPVMEMRITRHLSAGLELSFHRAEYQQTTEIRSGKKDPNAGTDNRKVTTIVDTTKVNYWDFPLLVRYRNIRETGLLKRFYPLAGITYRHVGNVRTGNEITNADATTDYNEIPDRLTKRNLIGFTGGIGFRLADELGIKLIPEIRFTHWQGHSLQGPSYSSNQNQAQAGIGITF